MFDSSGTDDTHPAPRRDTPAGARRADSAPAKDAPTADGSSADDPAGVVLTVEGLVDDAAVLDPALAVLRAVERDAARVLVAQCDALLVLWDTCPAQLRAGNRPHVLAEAGVALGLHPNSVAGGRVRTSV